MHGDDVGLFGRVGLEVKELPITLAGWGDGNHLPAGVANTAVAIFRLGSLALFPAANVSDEKTVGPRRAGVFKERHEAAPLDLQEQIAGKLNASQFGQGRKNRSEERRVGKECR